MKNLDKFTEGREGWFYLIQNKHAWLSQNKRRWMTNYCQHYLKGLFVTKSPFFRKYENI